MPVARGREEIHNHADIAHGLKRVFDFLMHLGHGSYLLGIQPGLFGGGDLAVVGGDEQVGLPSLGAGDVQGVEGAQRVVFQESDSGLDDFGREIDDGGVAHVLGQAQFGAGIILRG